MPASLSGPDLQALFSRLSMGDEQAFTEIFHYYTRKLYPFLLQKLRSDELAEELLQDVFLKLWIYRENLSRIESPEGYLFRMAANRVQDFFHDENMRKRLRQNLYPEAGHPGQTELAGQHPVETMDLDEARKLLSEGIRSLPEQRRKVYELKQQGFRYEEIAAQLDISPNTVKNQLVQANRFLMEFLRGHGLSVLLLILSWKRP